MNLNLISNLSIMPNYNNKLPEVDDILLQIKYTTSPTKFAGTLITVSRVTDKDVYFKGETSRWTRQLSVWNYYILLNTLPFSLEYKYYVEDNKIYSTTDRMPKTVNARSINLFRANTIAYFYKQNLLFIENPTVYDVLDIKFDDDKIYHIDGMNQTQGLDSIIELLSTRI